MREIRFLTKQEAASNKVGVTREQWPGVHGMAALKVAVLAKKEHVFIGGVKYHITYGFRRTYPVSRETVDSVRLNRADGEFAPMGYITLKDILAT
jgi:hypothetical protein